MIIEGGGKYNVKLIPQTCNREDAIREIITALDHLNSVSDEIFSTIKTRINSHRDQMASLSARVALASDQITSLKGSQKAIRIISPAKYPCEMPNPLADTIISQMAFPSLVSKNIPDPPVLGYDIEEDEELRCQRPLRFDSSIKHPNDLLAIFHVKENNLGDLNQLDTVADVGLGKPPQTIKNMDSFFLFNTVDNPYINYKMTERSQQDRHFGTLKLTRKGEEVQADVCPIVPQEGESEQKSVMDDFYYYPSSLEIPNIDVPESLPDLPGIADTFDLPDEPFSPMFPKLFSPTSPPDQFPASSSSKQISAPRNEIKTEEIPSMSITTPAQVPVPPQIQSTPSSSAPKPPNMPAAPPPPPPPPPPQMMESRKEEPKSSSSGASGGGGDLRSSLMAAIREAGGSGSAKLKSAKDRKYEAKKKKQDEKEKNITTELQEGGDLMADLKNTLAMRRRGISGIQDGQKRAGVSDIMLSLAATIPPMENSEEVLVNAPGSDEEDWD